MIVDIHGLVSSSGIPINPEKKLSELKYMQGFDYKKIQSNSHVLIIQYKEYLSEELLSIGGVTIIVLGKIFIKKNKNQLHYSSLQHILNLYFEKGVDFIDEVGGSFLLVLIDDNLNKLFLFNDKLGLYDFLYLRQGNDFYFSTNISSFSKLFGLKLNTKPASILQYFLFDSPLKDNSLFDEVASICPGYYVEVNSNESVLHKYHSYKDILLSTSKISWKETFEQIPEYFNDAVDALISQNQSICVGLTSGFDSRTNLSRLMAFQEKNILCYSWGLPQSLEIKIASEITNTLGLKYKPIFLTKEFEEEYDYYAHQSVMLSNGKGLITRSNHAYGYEILSKHSSLFFTGLMGSELLKPRNCGGYMFTQLFVDLLALNSNDKRREKLKEEINKLTFLRKDFIEGNLDNFLENTLEYFNEYNDINDFYLRLYYFMLRDGFRNYFGHDVHTNRIYGMVVSPYGDDDFIKFILQTPIPELNKSAFTDSLKSKLQGSRVYIPILKANSPILMNIGTGRFFKPKELESPFVFVHLLKSLIKKKVTKQEKTFDTERWVGSLIDRNKSILLSESEIFDDIENQYLNEKTKTKLYSIKYFLNNL